MARASSSKPRAPRAAARRRTAAPQTAAGAGGMAGTEGDAAPAGGEAVSGALTVAGLDDGAYAPRATAGNEADALPDGAVAGAAAGGHGAGAACAAGAGAAAAREPGAKAAVWLPAGLRRWLERARSLGLRTEEVVFELHVRQGLPLLEVARVLGLGAQAVQDLWRLGRAAHAARSPQCEADFAGLREQLCAALWQTVEETFPGLLHEAAEDDEDEAGARASAPMLSVRLKALDQIAKLYDVGLVQHTAAFAPLPYATPDDIAASVRERVLEMHGRGE